MPLRLDIKKALSQRSERVKCVDIHPSEPWLLAALYSGKVLMMDTNTSATIKSFDICELPVRSAKFIARKQWFMTASDDMQLRVYNYNTMEKVKAWERAHDDYIRYIEVHPTLPYVLTSSDDLTIKLWDWEKNWDCTNVFEGHGHYVMMIKINPKDTNTFASASLDRTVKVWGLTNSDGGANFSLEGHERGCNCVDYYPGGDKPYLISGADDTQIRIWDYQTKSCVQVLEGHSNNVSAVCFHPRLPLIVSASEDGTVRLWHSTTYRAETTLNYGMERAWALASTPDSNKLAIGFDEGAVVIQLGHEKPIASMDAHTGKLVWAKNNDIMTATLRGVAGDAADGDALSLGGRDLGSCEIFPQTLMHNCNGRFICVCGDGEYIVYTSQQLRNKSFGSALDFVWSGSGTGDYATRESISRVKIFKNFNENKTLRLPVSSAEGLYGGAMLGVKASDGVCFFDWDEGELVRKIDVVPENVYWSEAGDTVVLACTESYFVLRCDRDAVAVAIANGAVSGDGVDGAFEFVGEFADRVTTGKWVGECFLYTNANHRLNYYVGGQTLTLAHLDHEMYLLGYFAKEDRAFLVDKQLKIVSYNVLQSVLQYQTAVVRQDFEAANALLGDIPESEYPAVARFLESQGYKEEALQVSTDDDQRFDLAFELGRLEVALEVLSGLPEEEKETTDALLRWKKLGDLALRNGDLELLQRCATNSKDLAGLLLLHTAAGDRASMEALLEEAVAGGKMNIAFTTMLLLGRVEECADLLVKTRRFPEAALFARTYVPSRVPGILDLWRADLATVSETAAKALADPVAYPNLFPDMDVALQVEKIFMANRANTVPAANYLQAKGDLDLDLIAMVKANAAAAAPPAEPEAAAEPEAEAETAAEPEPEAAAEPAPAPAPEPEPEPEPEPAPAPSAAAAPLIIDDSLQPAAAEESKPVAAPGPEPDADGGAGLDDELDNLQIGGGDEDDDDELDLT